MRFCDIPTPALLLDLEAMERNLEKMAAFFSQKHTRLRPHYKNHKCPELAHRQLKAGAIGMTCATLSEAEALIAHGITNILISSELAGELKLSHFAELARLADIKAIVDNPKTVAALGAAIRKTKGHAGVLVNVNVGQNRTGVRPGPEVVDLSRRILAEGLIFKGLMGYEGHVGHLEEGREKLAAYDLAMNALMQCWRMIAHSGIPVEIVSTGGTGTYHLSPRFPDITESQAGSYLLMDTHYSRTCKDFERTLTVLGTVISKTGTDWVVIDAGLKSISAELGIPLVKNIHGLRLRKLNAEHGILDIVDSSLAIDVGNVVEIWVQYSDATVNLHDRIYSMREGRVEKVLQLQG